MRIGLLHECSNALYDLIVGGTAQRPIPCAEYPCTVIIMAITRPNNLSEALCKLSEKLLLPLSLIPLMIATVVCYWAVWSGCLSPLSLVIP